jgi:hypothetical protein
MENKMYTGTNENASYPLVITIDWADQKHDLAIYEQGEMSEDEILNKPQLLHDYFMAHCENQGWQQIAVVIEKTTSLLMHVLQSIELIDLYTIHPSTSAAYRETFTPSGAKNDVKDTICLLDIFLRHPDKIKKSKPFQITDALGKYTEKRRSFVDDRKSICNKLIAALKTSYPVSLELFKGAPIHSSRVVSFLKKWPVITDLKASSTTVIKNFFIKKRCKMSLLDNRLQAINETANFLDDDALSLYQLEISSLVQRIEVLNEIIDRYDEKIKELFISNKDFFIFSSFPGAGTALGPRVMAFFGNERERFSSAGEALLVSEIAPVTIQSGKSRIVRRRYLCNKVHQQTFIEMAQGSLLRSKWAKAYYDMKKSNGMAHNKILRSLAFKWIRIIYACWKSGVAYDESVYIKQLIKRGSKFVNNLELAC